MPRGARPWGRERARGPGVDLQVVTIGQCSQPAPAMCKPEVQSRWPGHWSVLSVAITWHRDMPVPVRDPGRSLSPNAGPHWQFAGVCYSQWRIGFCNEIQRCWRCTSLRAAVAVVSSFCQKAST
jgi:hypothetical protein